MSKSPDFSLADRRSANRAFDFIDRIRKVEDMAELESAFRVEANFFGFKYFIFALIPRKNEDFESGVVLNAWPEEWYKYYNAEGYAIRDPAARAVLQNALPFTWQEVKESKAVFGADLRIFDEVRVWEMNQGFCIPIRNLDGLEAVVSLAGRTVDISEAAKSALHLMAIYAYAKAGDLADTMPKQSSFVRRLSPRERECTAWIAAGKSSWEIGEILDLSELTVAAYIKNAMHKLNVVTRAQLVAEAIRLKEIIL